MSLFKFNGHKKPAAAKKNYRRALPGPIVVKDKTVEIAEPIEHRPTEEDIEISYINANMNSSLNEQETANIMDTGEISDYKYKCLDRVRYINLLGYVETIGKEAFNHCTNLEKLVIASSADNLAIGKSAFENCISLKEIDFKGKFRYIDENAFSNCSALEKINLTGLFIIKSNCFLLDFALKEVNGVSVIDIAPGAFLGCKSLETFYFGKNLKTIGSFAFSNCGFKELHLPKSVTTISGYAFEDNFNLTDVYFEHEPKSEIELGEDIFKHCKNVVIHSKNKIVIDYCNKNKYIVGD